MGEGRKRIAVFVGQADESYQSRFIKGFLESAFKYNMDVCVFSMYHKYQNNERHERGELNIFSLMRDDLFDGAVLLGDTIQAPGEAEKLETRLHKSFDKPVLVIEKESPYFPSILTECHDAIVELVSHLIEKHGCKDIAFLSGKKWHKHAQERLRAVRDCLEQHGLTLPDDRIIYGDFWYKSGELCADTLTSSGKPLPDAVVCANDAMAIGLCKAFEEMGIKVPDDIKVVSYDSTFEGQTSPKPITSSLIPAEEFGHYSADYMNDTFAGRETAAFKADPYLVVGETCGCTETNIPSYKLIRDEWATDISEEGFDSVNNTMPEEILNQTDLNEFIGSVYSFAFQIKGVNSFHLCLCDTWQYMSQSSDLSCPNNGYTDEIIYAIRYNRNRKDGIAGLENRFNKNLILPSLHEPSDKPRCFIFTPVFFEDHCFGYAAVDYGTTPRSYDDTYRRWILQVARGFEGLRRYLAFQFVSEQLSKLSSGKFAAFASAYDKLDDEERAEYELVRHILDENLLTYHFQPIVNTIDGRIYSYEALMRSKTEKRVPPLSIIKYADMQDRLNDVEKATFFNVLDIIEKNITQLGGTKIFINSIPGVQLSEEDFKHVEDRLNKFSNNIVVELTEEAELSDEDLNRLKELFKRLKIKIAVDDYGTGYSNVNNLLRYMPNYVKIDRALLSDIQNRPQKKHFVREIIGFCHDNGILALAEGVETTEELRAVILLGADLIQGYYTAKPSPEFISHIDESIIEEIKKYRTEYSEGSLEQKYFAGRTNRVSLAALVRDNVNEIIVGQGAMIYKDITVFGTPGVRTNVHIKVEDDYTGRITLENACLSNNKSFPTIEIGENADVTITIAGENTLRNSGILVPESSRLTLEGDGNLKIELYSSDYYGIGNLPTKAAGEIVLNQSGTLEIIGQGINGACIGAGKGGRIRITNGRYKLEANGHATVGIGVLSADANIIIDQCTIAIEFSGLKCVGIGSIAGNAGISISHCALSVYGSGTDIIGVGSMHGTNSRMLMDASSASITLNALKSTAIGAMFGKTRIETVSSVIKLECSGEKALAIGGYSEDQQIKMKDSDVRWNIKNDINCDCFAKPENFKIINGKGRFTLNDNIVDRKSNSE